VRQVCALTSFTTAELQACVKRAHEQTDKNGKSTKQRVTVLVFICVSVAILAGVAFMLFRQNHRYHEMPRLSELELELARPSNNL
jgi:hypothetical protein